MLSKEECFEYAVLLASGAMAPESSIGSEGEALATAKLKAAYNAVLAAYAAIPNQGPASYD